MNTQIETLNKQLLNETLVSNINIKILAILKYSLMFISGVFLASLIIMPSFQLIQLLFFVITLIVSVTILIEMSKIIPRIEYMRQLMMLTLTEIVEQQHIQEEAQEKQREKELIRGGFY